MVPGGNSGSDASVGGTTMGFPRSWTAWLAILLNAASEPSLCTEARKDFWTVAPALLVLHVRAGRSSFTVHSSGDGIGIVVGGTVARLIDFSVDLWGDFVDLEGCSASVDCVPLMGLERC